VWLARVVPPFQVRGRLQVIAVLYTLGDLVMVEQEDGYITVYTRAERVFVKKGESVKKGQVLGKVGKQGQDCGIGFELRLKDSSPVNFELVKE
jgi:septal ring factor EnvC (AmiA/AmiB activator)